MIVARIIRNPKLRPANRRRANPYPASEHRMMFDTIAVTDTMTVLPSHSMMSVWPKSFA